MNRLLTEQQLLLVSAYTHWGPKVWNHCENMGFQN